MGTITATELARQTRKALDAVASRGESIAIERNQVIIARLVPPEPLQNAAHALADFQPLLNARQAEAWLKASRAGFADELRDPWA